MTVVSGQIEPLKKLKATLGQQGITRFSSIRDINHFASNYESERKAIPKGIEEAFYAEISELKTEQINRQQRYEEAKADILQQLERETTELTKKLERANEKSDKNFFYRIIFYLNIRRLKHKRTYIADNRDKLVQKRIRTMEHLVTSVKDKLEDYLENKDKIISKRCDKSYKEIDATKKLIDDLYPLIAGAVGETAVVNELKKLPDTYYLINDFSVKFNPPIYNRKTKDRIMSIQADHLLVGQSGVFLLETKNWSTQSIKSLDLRSPIDQIQRTSYALFVLLNSQSNVNLTRHHWGSKKIPIRNIIVMTNQKPKEEFKHVKVLALKELNGYIQYFDQMFDEADTESIFKYLNNKVD